MRNDQEWMARIHGWLKPGGKLFAHISSQRYLSDPCENEGIDHWMEHFHRWADTLTRSVTVLAG